MPESRAEPTVRKTGPRVAALFLCLAATAAACSTGGQDPTPSPKPSTASGPLVIDGHDGVPSAFIEWSPDGIQVASSGDDAVRIWDATTGAAMHVLEPGSTFLEWSADGSWILTGGFDGILRVWDTATGEALQTLEHEDWIIDASLSPNGNLLVTSYGSGGEVNSLLWDTTSWEVVDDLGPYLVDGWSPDGGLLAISEDDGVAIRAAHTRELEVVVGEAFSAQFSPDGARIAGTSFESSVGIWDVTTGVMIHLLDGHTDWVDVVAWSPDGTQLVTAAGEDEVIVWDATTGEQIHALTAPPGFWGNVAWSPDGAYLAATFNGDAAAVWDSATGELVQTIEVNSGVTVNDLAWSPDGTRIATTHIDGAVRIWSVAVVR